MLYFDSICLLKNKTAHLLSLAEQEKWSEIDLLWTDYINVTAILPEIEWDVLPENHREMIEVAMRELQVAHAHLMSLVTAWHSELGILLQSTQQAKRILDTYR